MLGSVSRGGRYCQSPCPTFSDRQVRDEWGNNGYRQVNSRCQCSVLQSSTHLPLPFWDPTEHCPSNWNSLPSALHFILCRSVKSVVCRCFCDCSSASWLSSWLSYGTDTPPASQTPSATHFPPAPPLTSYSAYGQTLLSTAAK